jgi:hypothetical protein
MEKVSQWGLHNLYSSPDVIRQINSRKMRWAGHVARMGEGRNLYRALVGKPEGKGHLEDQVVDGVLGSKWTFGRLLSGVWIGFTWLRVGIMAGCCECDDEPSGSGASEFVC